MIHSLICGTTLYTGIGHAFAMLIKNIIPGIFSTAHAKPWRPVVHSSDGTQCLASAPPLSCTPAPWQLLPNEYMLDKIPSEVMTQHTECTHSSAFLGCQVRGGATKAAPELPPQRHEQGHPDGSGVCCQPQEGDPGAAGALLCVSTCHGGCSWTPLELCFLCTHFSGPLLGQVYLGSA